MLLGTGYGEGPSSVLGSRAPTVVMDRAIRVCRSLRPAILRHAIILMGLCTSGCGGQELPTAPGAFRGMVLAETYELGLAFASSSINVPTFRHQSILRLSGGVHAVAYYDENGDVRMDVVNRSGDTTKSLWITPRISAQLLGDGHSSISLGRSADGQVHVMYGAHATRPYYASIDEAILLNGEGDREVGATYWDRAITYPQFYQIGNQLQLWFRADPESAVHRTTYDARSKSFPEISDAILVPGDADRVYMNSLAISGGVVSLSWMYRLFSDDEVVRNEGLYLGQSITAGATWTDRNGVGLSLPISRGTVPALVVLPSAAQPLNQTASTYGPDGRLYITYYAKDIEGRHQIFLATVDADGDLVSSRAVSTNTIEYELFGRGTLVLPLSRPQIVASDEAVHVIYRQGDEIVVASMPTGSENGAWDYLNTQVDGLGAWEPTFSLDTWEAERRLLVFVQPARQGLLDTGVPGDPARARIFVFE
jgi:hypothetical protein